jgi:hypothetical protein
VIHGGVARARGCVGNLDPKLSTDQTEIGKASFLSLKKGGQLNGDFFRKEWFRSDAQKRGLTDATFVERELFRCIGQAE